MDKYDHDIVRILLKDARLSFSKLAEKVGLSKTPCWQRVNQLEKRGVIKGYSADIDVNAFGFSIRGLLHVVVEFSKSEQFERAVIQHDYVLRCSAVTGEYDYMVEILATNMTEFDRLLRSDLSRLPGVMRFNTSISTREVKPMTDVSALL